MTPLLTAEGFTELERARQAGVASLQCSLDLQRTVQTVQLHAECWQAGDTGYPYGTGARPRTIYYWQGSQFLPAARFSGGLVKLVPTPWGAPTFEIDGIKMLPSEAISPYEDAGRKVALIEPRNKVILDCCGGLGYFAAHALALGVRRMVSFEKNPDVLWLRSLNSWSPKADERLELHQADVSQQVAELPSGSVDAILHDPPRVSIAAELYSSRFAGADPQAGRAAVPLHRDAPACLPRAGSVG